MKKTLITILLSMGGAMIAFGAAVYHTYPTAAYVAWALSLSVFVLAFVVWRSDHEQIDIRISSCGDLRYNNANDIFERVKIELLKPTRVKIKGYSATLSRNGVIEPIEVVNDANKWMLHDSGSVNPRNHDMAALPNVLRSGCPVEAWVHFVVKKSLWELKSGELVLFAHAPGGGGHIPIPTTDERWNQSHETVIMPKV